MYGNGKEKGAYLKILLTGANGYIGKRLLARLFEQGHDIYALVRSGKRLNLLEPMRKKVQILEVDLLHKESLEKIPLDIDLAYYLVHSMTTSATSFSTLEATCAEHFKDHLAKTTARQIIYLSGLANESGLSTHLASRKQVETILHTGSVPVTTLMAGIIIGSGSASFEIIRDLVEKLPFMITPKWVSNLVQPIAIADVLDYLILVQNHPQCIGKRFDIGGPDILSYKQVLYTYAQIRGLKRFILSVPVLTPRLSSYWLYFMTTANYPLAISLVDSLKNNAVCKEHAITKIFPKKLLSYEEAVKKAFEKIEQADIPSSWKDAMGNSHLNADLSTYLRVPEHGTFSNRQAISFTESPEVVQQRIWSLGDKNGWLYMNWAWSLRGFFDKAIGGIGLRRGRTHPTRLKEGDALDFWRVLLVDESHHRLLLYAEMKLPGEAWLELKIIGKTLYQTATFRPRGLWGRLYWYALYPIHFFIFRGMAKKIANLK